jgi:hypothetical protein
MPTDTLSPELVQDIQRALRNGRPVEGTINDLRGATLPGLLEYQCLRWAHFSELPAFPRSIAESTLGQSLLDVPCELGLRSSGRPKSPPRDTNPHEAEFYLVREEADILDNQLFDEFLIRFEFSAKRAGLPKQTAIELHSALLEMAANTVNHAQSPVPALVGYEVRGDAASFCVVDVGRGILKSLQDNPDYSHLTLHAEAIRIALHDGVSRVTGPFRRGYGFSTVFKSLIAQWGELRFRSGEGLITMHGMKFGADCGEERHFPFLSGFQVSVCCRTKPPGP